LTSVTFNIPPFKDVYCKISLAVYPFTVYYIIIIVIIVRVFLWKSTQPTKILADTFPNQQSYILPLMGRYRTIPLILLNGIALRNLKSTALKAGDVLHIFPPAIGG